MDSTSPAIVLHNGIYKKTATVSEAVFMITGMTIGAGILGVPYVVAQVGITLGVAYIVVLGFITLALNLMVSDVVSATGESLQLPGLAGKYIGKYAKDLVSVTLVLRSYGALLAYVVGEGLALSTLFGGDSLTWSIIFWSVGSFLIWGGLNRIKRAEKILSLLVIALIVGLSLYLLPHFQWATTSSLSIEKLFIPFGVILFALSATPAIAEAHALMPGERARFRRAVFIGTIVPICVYLLFTLAVVGATGSATSEVASLTLGKMFGEGVLVVANAFAIFAMCTGFMGVGTALKETLVWDHHLSKPTAKFLVIAVPLLLLLTGFTGFVSILTVVGGFFIPIECMVMVVVYWQMKKQFPALHARAPWVMPLATFAAFLAVAFLQAYQMLF